MASQQVKDFERLPGECAPGDLLVAEREDGGSWDAYSADVAALSALFQE